MKITDFTYLLNRPDSVTEIQTIELERILSEFPYFQSVGALRLKGLYSQNSFRYNLELKKVASQTIDRTVLFDFITSEKYINGISHGFFEKKQKDVHDIEVVAVKWITPDQKREESILTSIKSSETKKEEAITEIVQTEVQEEIIHENSIVEVIQTEEKLEIEKPIEFSSSDTHSFQEWLQFTKFKPIVREEKSESVEKLDIIEEEKTEISEEKQKKISLIDKFIESNPKIIPDKNAPLNPVLDTKHSDSSTLMTETLAKVYLEQKKYQKAIDAYEILILKYPEKSVFFADRIENIKNLQQNNS